MPCECINTAVIMQNENGRLRDRIRFLENKLKKYQLELLNIYKLKKTIKIKSYKSR